MNKKFGQKVRQLRQQQVILENLSQVQSLFQDRLIPDLLNTVSVLTTLGPLLEGTELEGVQDEESVIEVVNKVQELLEALRKVAEDTGLIEVGR